jgi:hypothetical protein
MSWPTVGEKRTYHGRQWRRGWHVMVDSRSEDGMSWSTVGVRTICHGRQSEWGTTHHGRQSKWGRHTMVDSALRHKSMTKCIQQDECNMHSTRRPMQYVIHLGRYVMIGSRSGDDTPWSIVGVRTTHHGRQSTMVGSRSEDDTPWSTVGVRSTHHGRQSEGGRHTMVDSRSEDDM